MGLLIGPFLLSLVLLIIIAPEIKKISPKWQRPLFTTLFMLLLAPSIAPATILGIPIPFFYIFLVTLFVGALNESAQFLLQFWQMHLLSFPITGLIGYLLSVKIYAKQDPSIQNT